MRKRPLPFLVFIFAGFATVAYAQFDRQIKALNTRMMDTQIAVRSDALDFSKLESGAVRLKNPFMLPQMTVKKKPKVVRPNVEPKPQPPKPPEPKPDARSDNPRPDRPQPREPRHKSPVTPKKFFMKRPLPEVSINGIIWNTIRPQAILNGTIIDVGDSIEEIKVTGIQKSGIKGYFYKKAVIIDEKGVRYDQ